MIQSKPAVVALSNVVLRVEVEGLFQFAVRTAHGKAFVCNPICTKILATSTIDKG